MSNKLLLSLACATILTGAAIISKPALSQGTDAQGERVLETENVRESLGTAIREAVSTGLRTNPEYNAIRASRRATDEELTQGKALYRPSLDLRADTGYELTSDRNTRSSALIGDDEELFRSQASLTLTQMLFDGFATHYEVKRQKARVISSAHRVEETQQLVGLSIIEAYLNVLRQRYLASISKENVDDHYEILDQIDAGVKAGRSTNADLKQAKARLASSQAERANILENLEIAESQYYREVAAEPGDLLMPSVPYSTLQVKLEDEITYALANSPTLRIFESDIEVAYAEARATQSAYYPDVDLQVAGSYANDVNGVETYDKNVSALVVANWNLYRGGGDTAREREFRYRHEQSKANYANAARNLEDEVRTTWAGMIAAGTRAEKYTNQTSANKSVVKAYKDQFTLNRRTLLDVLDAQNELYVSKVNKINSEFVQMYSVYRLLALRGDLLATLGIDTYDAASMKNAHAQWSEADKLKAR